MSEPIFHELTQLSPPVLHQLIRRDDYAGHTNSFGQRHLQANLVTLQKSQADEFLRSCVLSLRAYPLLDVSEPGLPHSARLGVDIDVCSDLPHCGTYRRGQESVGVSDIGAFWKTDFIVFTIGCLFSFERALLNIGIGLRCLEPGHDAAMYRTAMATRPSGRLAGPTVVSTRPLKAVEAIRVTQVISRFPMTHDAPLYLGGPALIGIRDLARPDCSDPAPLAADEVPLFWTCGITPQAILAEAQSELYISYVSRHVLVSGRLHDEL